MRELYVSAVKTANEKVKAEAMGGGFDIMKKVYEKQRTTPKNKNKNQNNKYYTDGFDIMRKWQRQDTGQSFKKTQPIKEDFTIMKQIKEHPVPIKKDKKKSLMEPIEVDPPSPPVYNKYYF